MKTQHKTLEQTLSSYYQLHAPIYDLTRWSFLFGRIGILKKLQIPKKPYHIWEIGCGTGKNLSFLLKKHPTITCLGLDTSSEMIQIAQKKLKKYDQTCSILNTTYKVNHTEDWEKPDLILFSYSLSMINPGWKELLEQAQKDLKPGGHIAVVDFHQSTFSGFKKWMGVNHVEMNGHLLPALEALFTPIQKEIKSAYFGIWQYLLFVGKK
jgi:S-adenosylmethionine-diacylgycerolhomoserine-N-methlytransferase